MLYLISGDWGGRLWGGWVVILDDISILVQWSNWRKNLLHSKIPYRHEVIITSLLGLTFVCIAAFAIYPLHYHYDRKKLQNSSRLQQFSAAISRDIVWYLPNELLQKNKPKRCAARLLHGKTLNFVSLSSLKKCFPTVNTAEKRSKNRQATGKGKKYCMLSNILSLTC